jgi:hypothetical protein
VTTRRAAVYFVATRHAEYAAPAYFPEGSVVLDPWGYIPDQAGVNVIRIGRQPTPATISILCPTRGRPDQFARMVDSALDLAARPEAVEVVAYFDNDDPAGYQAGRYRAVRGPRILLSEAWNECRGAAAGPIYMHAGDDLIFRTRGWDGLVRDAFGQHPDRIVFVHGDDGAPAYNGDFGTHGFLHQNWVEAVGYFVPPYFSSDYNDTWLNDVANRIGRRQYLPALLTEHMHPDWGKAELDQTHRDRIERGQRDGVGAIYEQHEPDRARDAQKLRAVMTDG